MKGIHFSTIKRYQSLRADIDSVRLDEVMIFDDRLVDSSDKTRIVSRRLPAMSADELEEWRMTGLSNFAIVEMIYAEETSSEQTVKR